VRSVRDSGESLERTAKLLTDAVAIGTRVRYWTGAKEGPGKRGRIRHGFTVVGSSVVGWVDTHPACIAATQSEWDVEGGTDAGS